MDLPVSHVFRRDDARKIDGTALRGLISSIQEIGIINPLRVRPVRRLVNGEEADAYEVTAGNHRLQAALKIGLETVPCIVVSDDDLHAELAMIDENLCRAELSPADRASQTARRKELYLELHPESKHGGDRKSDQVDNLSTRSFAAETAEAIGKDERTVRRDAERGEKVAPDVLARVRGTHLDNGSYLDALKKLTHDEQREKVARALAVPVKKEAESRKQAMLDADVKARAAREAAEVIAEYVPADAWDGLKANLYAAGAKVVADALTNITGQSIMDRRYGT